LTDGERKTGSDFLLIKPPPDIADKFGKAREITAALELEKISANIFDLYVSKFLLGHL
jgi:hypothetical protein